MSAEEVTSWEAWLRRNPRGFHWENWVQANLQRAIMATVLGKNTPKLRDLLWKPSEALYITRARAEAQAKAPQRKKRGKAKQ